MTFIDLIGEDLFRSLPVRGVMAGSEAFPVGQMAYFEQDFGIQVAHWYGHSEYAVLAGLLPVVLRFPLRSNVRPGGVA